jgi:subtilase family serine protease
MGSLSPIAEVGNVTNHVDENVTPGTTYFYKISATNKMGEGPLSELAIISVNPLVDLILTTTDITFSNSTPMEGQMITIYGDIQAQNLAQTENVWVELLVDGTPLDVKPVTISGSSTQIQFNWTAEQGNHDISLDVDIINSVDESNEGNNGATKQISVSETSKPDLFIDSDSIEFSNNSPLEGNVVIINATIYTHNLSENLNVVVDLLVDNEMVSYATVHISSFVTIVSFNWAAEEGDHDIGIKVDTVDGILESNEANNEALKQITVQGIPIVDFAIESEDIEFSENEPLEENLIWINATIHSYNVTNSQSVVVEFMVDDIVKDYQTIVISSSDTIVSFSWTSESGNHIFGIKLDPMDSIVESNELNNHATKDLTVVQNLEPDLSISEISIVQSSFNESDEIDIEAVITAFNLPGSLQLNVEFYIDNILQTAKSITISNGTNDILFNWTAQKGGHNLKIKIDPQNAVLESSESNNIDSLDVHINTQTIDSKEKEGEDTGFSVMTLIFGVVFLIIGLIIGMILAKRVKDKEMEKKDYLDEEIVESKKEAGVEEEEKVGEEKEIEDDKEKEEVEEDRQFDENKEKV